MPKEYIRDEQYRAEARLDGSDETSRTVVVTTAMAKLTWGRDTYVQLAVVNDDDPDGMAETCQHLSLDRAGINQLVRTLRKARDQAYGSDA